NGRGNDLSDLLDVEADDLVKPVPGRIGEDQPFLAQGAASEFFDRPKQVGDYVHEEFARLRRGQPRIPVLADESIEQLLGPWGEAVLLDHYIEIAAGRMMRGEWSDCGG